MVQNVKINKTECSKVAERTIRLVQAIINSSHGKGDTELDTRFKRKLDRLKECVPYPFDNLLGRSEMIMFYRDLDAILSILQDLSSTDRVARVTKQVDSSQQLTECKDMLDEALQLFQVSAAYFNLHCILLIPSSD